MQATTQVREAVDTVPLRGQGDESHSRRRVVGGALLAFAGIGMIMAIITNEALYRTR